MRGGSKAVEPFVGWRGRLYCTYRSVVSGTDVTPLLHDAGQGSAPHRIPGVAREDACVLRTLHSGDEPLSVNEAHVFDPHLARASPREVEEKDRLDARRPLG